MEHRAEAENAAGHFGNVTESAVPPSGPGSRGGKQRQGAPGAMLGLLTALSCLACTERQATLWWEIGPGDLIRSTSPPLPRSRGVTCYPHTVQQRHPGFRLPYWVLSV